MPGQWSVRVLYNGTSFFTEPFRIEPAFGQEDVSKCVSPRALNLVAVAGAAPTRHVLQLGDTGPSDCTVDIPEPVNFSVSFLNGTGWLNVPASVNLLPGRINTLTVQVNYRALAAPGVYQALILARACTPDPQPCTATIPVTVALTAPRARLVLSQAAFVFSAVQGGVAPPAQALRIGAENGSVNWSVSVSAAPWLQVSPSSGSASPTVAASATLTANPAGLAPGDYQALVTVAAPGAVNDPQLLNATLRVAPPANPPAPTLSTHGLLFIAAQGGAAPAAQSFTVHNAGGGSLSAQFAASTTSGGDWLSVSPASATVGNAPVSVRTSANSSGLAAGVYRGKITCTFSPSGPQEIDVALVVSAGPVGLQRRASAGQAAQCTPTSLELVATTLGNGLSLPVGFPKVLLTLAVDNCGAAVADSTVLAAVEGLSISLQSVGSGLYTGTWVPQRAAASVPVTFLALHPTFTTPARRSFTVSTSAAGTAAELPTLFEGGVAEGAGFTGFRPLAPGGIVTLFGARLARTEAQATQFPLERELAGASVRIGRYIAPLYYVGPGQINAQVPYEVVPGESVAVLIIAGGLLTLPQNYLVAPAQPGIFKAGNVAAILDSSFRLITPDNPARIGDTLQIFSAGLGATDPAFETGARASGLSTVRLPVTVLIGGIEATVAYQGLAPNFVGLYQVNAVVPAGVAPGDAVEVVLRQNGISSNPNLPITIPIRAP